MIALILFNNYFGWQVRRFFHSHFKVDRDLQSSVVLYSQKNVL
jgi:GPI mannosyltransferase 3